MTTSLNRQAIISGTIYLYILLDNNSPRTIRKKSTDTFPIFLVLIKNVVNLIIINKNI